MGDGLLDVYEAFGRARRFCHAQGFTLGQAALMITIADRHMSRTRAEADAAGKWAVTTRRGPEMTQTWLAYELGLEIATLTRPLAGLVQDGWLTKRPHATDRRLREYRCTPRALAVVITLKEWSSGD